MTPRCQQVLKQLQHKRNGVTFGDFPTGFRLGARIFELRQSGLEIVTVRESMGDGFRARYVLAGSGGR